MAKRVPEVNRKEVVTAEQKRLRNREKRARQRMRHIKTENWNRKTDKNPRQIPNTSKVFAEKRHSIEEKKS